MSDESNIKNSTSQFCYVPKIPKKKYQENISNERLELIRIISLKWVNGTVLHYYFFDGPILGTSEPQKEVVRRAFEEWKKIGIGLQFEEVSSPADAEIRIGFKQSDGSWSYPGTYILEIGQNERTMNFGWSLTGSEFGFDTAIHEIGHTLGFPHEHQNPNAGIVWNEDEVYRRFRGPPNNWNDKKIFHNILKKISPDTVAGSNWDPNSIMHYSFGPGLVLEPQQYKGGIEPEHGLSKKDIEMAKFFYPPLENVFPELKLLESEVISIIPGEQKNFTVSPNETRDYHFSTFGSSDTVMVLFEEDGNELRYVNGDDDSGENRNSSFTTRLIKGKNYILRVRLYYQFSSGNTAVMMW